MSVDGNVLEHAREGDREAIVDVLAAHYPSTYRIAHAIAGRTDVGDGVVAYVMKQSFRVVERWKDDDAPRRWFRHHTLLTLRRATKWKPDAAQDTLVLESDRTETNYVAFIRALRGLPQQQIEAFVLTHGERLDLRECAVAMDCSTTAASIHLKEAEDRLRGLAGERFDALLARLREAHERLTPSGDLVLSRVRLSARPRFWPRLVRLTIRFALLLALLGALGWLAWRFGRPTLDDWTHRSQPSAHRVTSPRRA